LIVTPYYEVEFNGTGGIKYIKNNDDILFFSGDNILARTNKIQKLPVLLQRDINKIASQKKLIVKEKYNYEEKFEITQDIILYYLENRIDFQVVFSKNNEYKTKDITDEFELNFYFPEFDIISEVKNFDNQNQNQNSDSMVLNHIEYLLLSLNKNKGSITIYPEINQNIILKNKNIVFSVPNLESTTKNYINLKFYLEKYIKI